jgi:hypothetical protein
MSDNSKKTQTTKKGNFSYNPPPKTITGSYNPPPKPQAKPVKK